MKVKALVCLMTAVMSYSLYAADTNINITGTVKASPCTVNGGNTDLSVNLGDDIQAAALTAGTYTTPVDVILNLTNCPLGTSSVMASFSGTSDPVAGTNYYKNTGSAGNVAVALTEASTGNFKSNSATMTQSVVGGMATFALKARAYTSAGNVTPGTIRSTVVVGMTYN